LATPRDLSDTDLFDEVLRRRTRGEDPRALLGDLCERWRKPAGVVIRRIQASYRVEAPDDEPELFQDAVQRLIERGLDQYRGVSEQLPGKSASPKTFFLRIVKHLSIDRYRQKRELLEAGSSEEDESPHASVTLAKMRRKSTGQPSSACKMSTPTRPPPGTSTTTRTSRITTNVPGFFPSPWPTRTSE
jgi:hypothetical protein